MATMIGNGEVVVERISAADWLTEYVGVGDGLWLGEFRDWFASLAPAYRSMRGISDRQAWVDEYSRIQWQSSSRRQAMGEPLYTCNAGELAACLDELLA